MNNIDFKRLKEYDFYLELRRQAWPYIRIVIIMSVMSVVLLLLVCAITIIAQSMWYLMGLMFPIPCAALAIMAYRDSAKYDINPHFNLLRKLSALSSDELDSINRTFLDRGKNSKSFDNTIITDKYIITYRAFCPYKDIIKIERWSGTALSDDRSRPDPYDARRRSPKEYNHYLIISTQDSQTNVVFFAPKYTPEKIKKLVDEIVTRCDHEVEITGGHDTRY